MWQKIRPDKVIFDGKWRKVLEKTYKMPDGTEKSFEILNAQFDHRAVGIVAVTEDGMAVVAEQYRPGPDELLQEIPAGMVDEGEDLKVAALRELKEETGYEGDPAKTIYLGPYWRDPYYDLASHYFFVPDVKLVTKQKLDEGEFVDVKLVHPAELLEIARAGKTTEAVGVLLARDYLEKYKE
ncbi:MAG: NUDIX hydrolase [Candidatus Nomurabacteria bacterium]|jgi:ADP-ribose pyrophosphatase|nr:NUDIX hydrolase [Candidatus Nomurabacteria bacterium]